MDTAVDNFLKEINELVPPKPKIVWKECFDETSGFSYYWNTETDEVTWDPPSEFKKQPKPAGGGGNNKLFIPPPSEPKFKLCSLPKVDEVNVKIYKINDALNACETDGKSKRIIDNKNKKSEVNNEKPVLISSYGSSSESDGENDENAADIKAGTAVMSEHQLPNTENHSCKIQVDSNQSNSSNFDAVEVDILSRNQKKTYDLKKAAVEVSADAKKLIDGPTGQKKGFSLVPGYGEDSDDEFDDQLEAPSLSSESITTNPLFPAAKSIEVLKNIEETERACPETNKSPREEIDPKLFQRKRRIGVSLTNTLPKKKVTEEKLTEKNTEIDIRTKPEEAAPKKIEYPGFTRGEILFGSNTSSTESADEIVKKDIVDHELNEIINGEFKSDDVMVDEIKNIRGTLEEKLKFLCEGHQEALPVQVMIIQMETLYTAMLERCLKPSYLKNWLKSTAEDLTKLEREAAPVGWLLQWDSLNNRTAKKTRLNKRYYYHNRATGESQWEYPQTDGIRTEEAMDISMTPPHQSPCEEVVQSDVAGRKEPVAVPPAPNIREKSISPPPPPIISKTSTIIEQPLPPGVEEEIPDKPEANITQNGNNGSFSSELNSFYSDIAAIEKSVQPPQGVVKSEPEVVKVEANIEEPPKKKKKVKVASGLAMKKKGVSQMVEKWKNLQKNYD